MSAESAGLCPGAAAGQAQHAAVHLALYQPQIPQNTGNIGRLCVGLATHLHIIGPCAFDFSDQRLRRAGLDYWPHLQWTLYPGPEEFLTWLGERIPYLVSRYGAQRYDQVAYTPDDILICGNEARGVPAEWLTRWPRHSIRIPQLGPVRSLNLANSASIVLAEACRVSGRFGNELAPEAP